MSADSPNRSRSQSRASGERVTISPQQVTDPTILDSVAVFINDVVPNAYNVPCDSKDQIQWAHFEQLEFEDLICSPNADCDKIIPPPLLLVLGYTSGIQIWAVTANGEATEILSWRHGAVRVLKVLPTPNVIGNSTVDVYATKRPLIALCDNATPGPHYCSLSFISLKTGEQVKIIKFKNPLLEVLANRHSVVVTFAERIAVFDAFTLEDRLTVTTCYLSPGIYPNPVALGTRWMAYAENKLMSSRRSSGGNDGEGVQSYTATVLHAAKSLGRGLRELSETVASSLTGNVQHKPGMSSCHMGGGQNEVLQKGIVTILDIESTDIDTTEKTIENEAFIAHFTAHTEAIVCLKFDPSGMLLLTADKRGHDFHLFRIHPHPAGPSLAAVHHLYVLHRGDTTARVQDMSFSPDSRWVTVSTLRGTTHVFPITPYGGSVGVRTHATPHVVNRMSRFHRSAGLTAEGRSNSPVALFEAPINSNLPYHNPRIPPYPHPTAVFPLAQIRQPIYVQSSGNTQQRPHSSRPRLSSSSEDNIQVVLRVCAFFAAPRAWIDKLTPPRDTSLSKPVNKPIESLFIMSCHGSLVQYDLDPQHISSIPKEKVCDDTPIELSVRAKAQWILQRQANGKDVQLPLPKDYLQYFHRELPSAKNSRRPDHTDDRWVSQVEIVTHAGPHRRLWMGPQFTFKTYNTSSGTSMNILESKPIDVGRSKPVNMPMTGTYPVLIEAGSVSSCEPSPKLLDTCQKNFDEIGAPCELQLREDLADAMLESPGVREAGGRCVIVSMKHHHATGVAKVVNPLGTVVTVQSDDDADVESTAEEIVIHENCDEALFRPVVASKAVVFAEPKNVQNKISHSVLHVNRTPECIIRDKVADDFYSEVDSGIEKERDTTTYQMPPLKPLKPTAVSEYNKLGKMCCDISSSIIIDDLPDTFVPITESDNYKKAIKIETPDPLGSLDFTIGDADVYTMKSQIDALQRGSSNNKERKIRNDKYHYEVESVKEMISSSEENAAEDKHLPKKTRKPKTKLGVRITNVVSKDFNEEHEKEDDAYVEFTMPLPKKSWSAVAASQPQKAKTSDTEIEAKIILPVEVESVDHFSVPPTKCLVDEDEDDDDDDKQCVEKPRKMRYEFDDLNFLKVDKSSDEDKPENTSSQTETTESDDSSKIKVESTAMDTEEDTCQPEIIQSSLVSVKTGKKKSKKKRR